MYTRCMFCKRRFRRNRALAGFSIGTLLVYDPEWERLWVVCDNCHRWHDAPPQPSALFQELERLHASSTARFARGRVTLRKVRGGLRLVRVGAAEPWKHWGGWRHERVIRSRLHACQAKLAAGWLMNVPYVAVRFFVPHGHQIAQVVGGLLAAGIIAIPFRTWLDMKTADGRRVKLTHIEVAYAQLRKGETEGDVRLVMGVGPRQVELAGEDLLRALVQILPRINLLGARQKQVDRAVELVSSLGGPQALLARAAWPKQVVDEGPQSWKRRLLAVTPAGWLPGLITRWMEGCISGMPVATRLALEMMAFEQYEVSGLAREAGLLEMRLAQAEQVTEIMERELGQEPRGETKEEEARPGEKDEEDESDE